jgi:hypothetical protein
MMSLKASAASASACMQDTTTTTRGNGSAREVVRHLDPFQSPNEQVSLASNRRLFLIPQIVIKAHTNDINKQLYPV